MAEKPQNEILVWSDNDATKSFNHFVLLIFLLFYWRIFGYFNKFLKTIFYNFFVFKLLFLKCICYLKENPYVIEKNGICYSALY